LADLNSISPPQSQTPQAPIELALQAHGSKEELLESPEVKAAVDQALKKMEDEREQRKREAKEAKDARRKMERETGTGSPLPSPRN